MSDAFCCCTPTLVCQGTSTAASSPHLALHLPPSAAAPAGTVTANASGAGIPVVIATCTASDMTPRDTLTPWCEAAVAAGVPHVMVVTDHDGCVAAAKKAGVKVLKHTFQVRPAVAQANGAGIAMHAMWWRVMPGSNGGEIRCPQTAKLGHQDLEHNHSIELPSGPLLAPQTGDVFVTSN